MNMHGLHQRAASEPNVRATFETRHAASEETGHAATQNPHNNKGSVNLYKFDQRATRTVHAHGYKLHSSPH